MFSKRPKAFDTIYMIFRFGKFLSMANGMMFSKSFQGAITTKGVSEVDRSFLGMLSNMLHQFIGRDRINNFGIDPSIALQKPKNDAFSSCTASSFAFATTTKIRFVQFYLSFEFSSFELAHMINCFSNSLIHACDCFIVYTKVTCQSIRRLLLIKTKNDFQLSAKKMASFLSL